MEPTDFPRLLGNLVERPDRAAQFLVGELLVVGRRQGAGNRGAWFFEGALRRTGRDLNWLVTAPSTSSKQGKRLNNDNGRADRCPS